MDDDVGLEVVDPEVLDAAAQLAPVGGVERRREHHLVEVGVVVDQVEAVGVDLAADLELADRHDRFDELLLVVLGRALALDRAW